MRVVIAAVLLAAIILGLRPDDLDAARSSSCKSECQSTYEADSDACVAGQVGGSDWLSRRDACTEVRGSDYQSCQGQCQGAAIPGRCSNTRNCLDRCRLRRSSGLAWCNRHWSARRFCNGLDVLDDQVECFSCLRDARRARDTCKKDCRLEPPATVAQASEAFQLEPRATDDDPAAAAACRMQKRCVRRVLSYCYGQCTKACGVDFVALGLCQRACRNDRCVSMQECQRNECDEEVSCETTSTHTAPTTSSTTTTTTTVAGATTTTTTTLR